MEERKKGNVHVKTAVRWREKTENRDVIVQKVDNNLVNVITNPDPLMNPDAFVVDNVFDSSEQIEVFNVLVKPLIDKAIEGFGCTFLATGQTGSGKTYTMGFERSVDPENSGIVTRVLNSLFSHENAEKIQTKISFVEVYNDQPFDLLNPNPQKLYKKDRLIQFKCDVIKQSVNSEAEVLSLLSIGTEKRRVRGTKMNSISSRSHVIFTIYLNIIQNDNSVRPSVINLVDLAGSEGFGKTDSNGQAQTEGKSINEGLSAFKRVFSAMRNSNVHIPFRDSVITNLLEESLNRDSYLTLLGCISPYKEDKGEILSTLRFVCDAKNIKMTPQQKEIIINHRKSMTPVKKINVNETLKTPNSSFKLPRPLSTIQNKMISSSMQKSIKKCTSVKVSSASKLPSRLSSMSASKFPRRMSTISSSSKKTGLNRSNQSFRNSFDGQTNKRKVVTSLFPKVNDTTFTSDSIASIDLSNASTSSKIEFDLIPLEEMPLYPPLDPGPIEPSNANEAPLNHTDILREKLAQTLSEIHTPVRERIIRDVMLITTTNNQFKTTNENVDKQNDVNEVKPEQPIIQPLPSSLPLPSSPLSSPPPPPTALKSLLENDIDPTAPVKSINESDELPIWDDMNVVTMIENEIPQTDEIDIPLLDNLSDNILLTTTTDHVPSESPPSCATINDESENLISLPRPFPCLDVITEVSEVNSIKEVSERTIEQSMATSNLVKENNVSVAMSDLSHIERKYDYIFDKFAPEMIEENVVAFVSPMVVRKIEKGLEKSSFYEIVKKDRNAQPLIESCAEFSYAEVEYSFDDQQMDEYSISDESAVETPKTPDMPVKTPAAMRKNIIRLPNSPRLILHRIENIRDYQQSLKRPTSAMAVEETRKSKRAKVTRIESTRNASRAKTTKKVTKSKTKAATTSSAPSNAASISPSVTSTLEAKIHENRKAVLNILNTGTAKDLQKLSVIGPKKAQSICQYRELHGEFMDIDAMKKMPFWSLKVHQRFLDGNNLGF